MSVNEEIQRISSDRREGGGRETEGDRNPVDDFYSLVMVSFGRKEDVSLLPIHSLHMSHHD